MRRDPQHVTIALAESESDEHELSRNGDTRSSTGTIEATNFRNDSTDLLPQGRATGDGKEETFSRGSIFF